MLRSIQAILFSALTLVSFLVSGQRPQAQNAALERVNNLIIDSKYTEAIAAIDVALSQEKDLNTIILLENKKTEALTRDGKLQDAEKLLAAIEEKLKGPATTTFCRAVTDRNIGFLQLNQGRNDLAEESLQKSLQSFGKSDNKDVLEEAQALATLGMVYLAMGNYSQAEEQLQMALAKRLAKLQESHELIAATYNDLGLVFSQTDQEKALDYYEKALTIYKKLHGEDHLKIAFASINTGVVYRNMELYGDAVNNFETALRILEKVYVQPHPSKAIALYNLGQTYLKMNNEKDAMQFYERALKMYEDSYGKKHPEVANVLNSIGNLQVAERRYDEALASYQNALKANVADFHSDNIEINPKLRNFYNGTRLLQSLLFKAQAFESKYFGRTIKFSDLHQSLNVLQKCDTLIDLLRQQINNENDKILLGIVATEVYEDGVRIAHTAGLNAFKKKPYFEQAFYFAEKSKSAVLMDAISESNAKSFAGIPESLLNEEKELKSAIALCAQKLALRPTPEEEKYLRETAFSLNRSYEAFIKKLETDYPGYFDLKFNQTSPSIGELQKVLDRQTTILSYFTDERNNRLYIFEISKGRYRINDKLLPADFVKNVTGLRNSLFYNDPKTFKLTAYSLYKLLVPANLTASTRRLVILPTGRMSTLPFEALLTSEVDEKRSYASLPFLLRKYSIQYEFSAGLLLQKTRDKITSTSPSIFLCAPVTFTGQVRLNDLPGTELEVNEIADLFRQKQLTAKVVTRKEATKAAIQSNELRQYNFLHLATHGVVDESRPELSRIYLQSSGPSEEGNLFAGEIYNLELDARLVTLSACETGLGKISKGEGVIGLSRALVYAGAKNIIVSYWSVADESTAELMKYFYESLLNSPGSTLSEHLRIAKLRLLAKEQYSAPFYWAPFILIGF